VSRMESGEGVTYIEMQASLEVEAPELRPEGASLARNLVQEPSKPSMVVGTCSLSYVEG
jgi:hypothetical protein